MSRENVQIVQRQWSHFAETGELELATLHPDLEIHDHDLPDAGAYRGRVAFDHWTSDWAQAWEDYAMRPESFIDAGDRVVVLVRLTATGAGSGVTVRRQDGMVYELRDGLIVRIDYFNNRADALAAAGMGG